MFLFGEHVHSHNPALLSAADDKRWSWIELAATVKRVAESLRSERKLLTFLFCRNDAATVFSYLAAIEAGHAVALLDERLAVEYRDRLIQLYRPDLIVSSSELKDIPPGFTFSKLEADIHIFRNLEASDVAPYPDLALLLSTSGSTGTPKFVRLTKHNVESNADSIRKALRLTEDERPITSLPLHYSYGLSILNSHLVAGAPIVLTGESLTAPGFWSAFRENRCTSWAGVPYSYGILRRLDFDKLDVPSLKTLTQAGGKLNSELVDEFHRKIQGRGGQMFVMYGQTEATARISVLPAERLAEKLGSAGQPVPGGSIVIETDEGYTSSPNITGEIVYRGPNVMMGYATCREDLALGDVLKGQLHTGDTGYLDQDGFIHITGRRKRDAKVFGLRLNMDEVEDILRVHGPTAIISGGEKLLVFCEHGDASLFRTYSRELSAKLKLHAGAFEFLRVERLPLNASGKVDYAKLEEIRQ